MTQHRTKARRRKRQGLLWAAAAAICLAAASQASAQLGTRLGSGLGLPLGVPLIDNLPSKVAGDADEAANVSRSAVSRLERMRALVRANPKVLDVDEAGDAVVRGAVIALDPSPVSLAIIRRAGFTVAAPQTLDGLGIAIGMLRAPPGLDTRAAVARLRALDPGGLYDYDHLYTATGALSGVGAAPANGPPHGQGRFVVGLVDTGVAADHPAFAATSIRQQGFAPGGVRPAAHGTAVAFLVLGDRNTVAGGRLFAADVYGQGPTGGSADSILHALAWLGHEQAPVINISLVGPPNLLLQAAIRSLTGRGVLIVAPVGNDGPAAPPPYPASYPDVIAVTGVDTRHRVLPEAGRALHLDFAALGAGVRAARPGGGYERVRGTSFAAPVVAGELARLLPAPDRALAARAVRTLAERADKTGGGDLGMGLVGDDVTGRERASGR